MRRRSDRRGFGAVATFVPLLLFVVVALSVCQDALRSVKHSFSEVNFEGERQLRQETRKEERSPLGAAFTSKAQSILNGSRLVGDGLDVHMFVLWQHAYPQWRAILQDICKSFVVLELAEFDWGDTRMGLQRFLSNLWVLYNGKGGWEREGMAKKVQQCGYGRFIAIAVADMNPQYARKHTAHGVDIVNVMAHKKKVLYRKWSGGGFKVHGTFSTHEANHDIRVLLHTTIEGLLLRAMETQAYARDIVSAYLDDPAPFYTTREAYGATNLENKGSNGKADDNAVRYHQQGWRCDAFFFALGSLMQVAVVDGRTGVLLWSQRSSLPGTPLAVYVVTKTECAAWPDKLELRISLSEMWGAVALLRASPVNAVGVTLSSEFTVELEGSTRVLLLTPFK
ncbi:hypothetical protein TcYC6_0077800 [Trypanosoma cruzi]|uniref:Uncharacterized protein n=1 Tax=Trypanosoma cruzi TaxID=5693 RepID=A0A7J6Y0E0_TRYCR|nr:hypothetical protein ECC02_006971 [Trypanosoma cruzi]KAF8298029.1 hypothetical protein TcYC6_0078020 [Trypanosoma cruzi]KAF8298047.1 hypothetical protein TcYC6_0077800 [Trypanosoma cruzi]